MNRAYTEEEARDMLITHFRRLARYWAEEPDLAPLERTEGMAHSILCIFDGVTTALPALDISLAPHPDDKQYHISNGEDYFEPGMVINNCMLHDEFHKANHDT